MSANITATKREKLGSRASRKLRLNGQIPCSLHAEGHDPVAFSIDEATFLTARRAHAHLFDLEFGDKSEAALIQELQWNTFLGRIIHVEFRHVVRGTKTESEVGLKFKGNVKGGVMNHLVTHLTFLTLPSQIPDEIVVDVDGLDTGATIHASDLVLPEGCELVSDPTTTIVTVSAVRASKTADEEEVEAEGEGGEE